MNAYIIDGHIYNYDRAVLENGVIRLYNHGELCTMAISEWTTFEVLELN